MMTLTVLGSGSDGNGYILECGGEALILDCGVSPKQAKLALDFDISKVVGCFISHRHTDHSKYRKDYSLWGVDMFTPYDDGTKIRANKQCGGFALQAFRLPHGDEICFGLLIRHKRGDTALYMTDFGYTEYSFVGCKVNLFIVECNWQEKYVDMESENFKHKVADHCSFEVCKKFLEVNKTDSMNGVLLVHMGKDSANPKECVAEIQNVLGDGVKVDYARPNETYEFKGKEALPWDI